MRSLPARLAVTAVAFVALAPVSAVHAAPPPATLRDVPLPFLWPRAGVYSVAAVSDTEAWFAGVQGFVNEPGGNPVVRRRMGSEWREYPLRGWSGSGGIQEVVAHGGEVWVWGVQDGTRLYLARFDGTAFQPVAPLSGDVYVYGTRLWAGPAGVWLQIKVVGSDSVIRPELFRRVGDAWTADPLAGQLQGGLPDLNARSATEAWTGSCRYNADAGRLESVALRWNGSTWAALPPLPTEHCVGSVAPAGGGAVWALAWDTLYHWDGTRWTSAPAGPFDGEGEKVRLDKDGNPLVVVGHTIKFAPVPPLRYAGGAWQRFTTPGGTWTSDLSVAPSGRIWVTGSTRIDSPVALTSP